jgi:hypothetical protein
MEVSLGYLKDLLAFIFALIMIFLIFILKVKIPIIIYKLLIILIFLIDGTFSILPFLHNFKIKIF